nr:hypothetical protein [Mesorhizobium comanense]
MAVWRLPLSAIQEGDNGFAVGKEWIAYCIFARHRLGHGHIIDLCDAFRPNEDSAQCVSLFVDVRVHLTDKQTPPAFGLGFLVEVDGAEPNRTA